MFEKKNKKNLLQDMQEEINQCTKKNDFIPELR